MDEVKFHLFIGDAKSVTEESLRENGITCVINCRNRQPDYPTSFIRYVNVPVDDVCCEDIKRYFDEIADVIYEEKQRGGRTLVHCKAGISRSATICIAYLMKYERFSLRDAYQHLKSRRRVVCPNKGFYLQLVDFQTILFNRNLEKVPEIFTRDTYEALFNGAHETCTAFHYNEALLNQLFDMGFPLHGCQRALYYTQNGSIHTALNWVMEHKEDADFSEPLNLPGTEKSNKDFDANPESVDSIVAMGFAPYQAIQALEATNNNLERAIDWLFNHTDEMETEMDTIYPPMEVNFRDETEIEKEDIADSKPDEKSEDKSKTEKGITSEKTTVGDKSESGEKVTDKEVAGGEKEDIVNVKMDEKSDDKSRTEKRKTSEKMKVEDNSESCEKISDKEEADEKSKAGTEDLYWTNTPPLNHLHATQFGNHWST